MMNTLYLLRGLPGSGKTTLAKKLNSLYLEADMFFYRNDGNKYQFDASKLPEAHKWCLDKVEENLTYQSFDVCVSNTFTTEKEMQPYIDLAKRYDYQLISIIVENRHGNKSVHNVPNYTMMKMHERMLNNIKLR